MWHYVSATIIDIISYIYFLLCYNFLKINEKTQACTIVSVWNYLLIIDISLYQWMNWFNRLIVTDGVPKNTYYPGEETGL